MPDAVRIPSLFDSWNSLSSKGSVNVNGFNAVQFCYDGFDIPGNCVQCICFTGPILFPQTFFLKSVFGSRNYFDEAVFIHFLRQLKSQFRKGSQNFSWRVRQPLWFKCIIRLLPKINLPKSLSYCCIFYCAILCVPDKCETFRRGRHQCLSLEIASKTLPLFRAVSSSGLQLLNNVNGY
jgi:hypothetical protein